MKKGGLFRIRATVKNPLYYIENLGTSDIYVYSYSRATQNILYQVLTIQNLFVFSAIEVKNIDMTYLWGLGIDSAS